MTTVTITNVAMRCPYCGKVVAVIENRHVDIAQRLAITMNCCNQRCRASGIPIGILDIRA